MRLKTFVAPTMAEAMRAVRAALGEDAIIVSSEEEGGRVRLTAALEAEPVAEPSATAPAEPGEVAATLERLFEYHGAPLEVSGRLLRAAAALGLDDPLMALAGALDVEFRFAPLGEADDARPYMLVGPPGAGKTVTVAKLAARAHLAGVPTAVVTTDGAKAGGIAQLKALTDILGIELGVAADAAALAREMRAARHAAAVFVDTAAINPFDEAALERTAALAAAIGAEPVVVLAGGDAIEAADIAARLARLGARRLVTPRLDATRRLGGMLGAAGGGGLMFAEIGTTAHIADGLAALNPLSFARLLMRDPDARTDEPVPAEAA